MTVLGLRRQISGLGLSPRRRAPQGPALPSIVQDGLIAAWPFNDGAGQVLTDSTGNGHHGRLGSTPGADAADPTWTPQGLSFDGGDFVECDNAGISGGVARSVALVIQTNSNSLDNFAVEWRGDGGASKRLTIKCGSNRFLRTEYQAGGFTSSTLQAAASTWHYIAYTQSGSNSNTGILYLDGASDAVTQNRTLDTVGNFFWGTGAGTPYPMAAAYGLVYNRALSPAEVEQNRQALKVLLAPRGITLP